MRFTRIIALTLLCEGLAATVAAAASLGGYQWGASASTITAETGAVPATGESGDLVKREAVLGRQAYVSYRFDRTGLSAVGIQWDESIFPLVKKELDAQYGPPLCSNDLHSCTWTSPRSTIRLVEPTSLGVTLLVFAKRP